MWLRNTVCAWLYKYPMSVTEQTRIAATDAARQPPPRRNGRWAGYLHLLMARMRELQREPEVVFWVFVFPLLLAAGLGIAFRNKPADITSVVIIDGPAAQRTLAMLQGSETGLADKSAANDKTSSVRASVLDRDAALKAFHFGKYDLAIEANADGSFTYYYDPARPESVLSRAEIDAKLQSAFASIAR